MGEAGAFNDMWVELVDGELERMPPPGNSHAARQADVVISLGSVIAKALIRAEVGVDLGDETALSCDAAVLRAPVEGNGLLQPVDVGLVVEIAESTRDRDMGMKRRRYAAAGIPLYWVVDGERGVVHIYDRPEGDDYMGVAVVRFGEPLAVPGTDATIVLE